jgi:hypothetical protein
MKAKLITLFLAISIASYSQEIMSIEQVFDFNVGDIFQYKSSLQNQPPNALTNEVIDKYYSENGDTLFYVMHCSYYTSDYEFNPEPHLVYNFGEGTVIKEYTNLDSPILDYFPHLRYDTLVAIYVDDFNYDTIVENSILLCDRFSNGFDCSFAASAVEPNYYNYRFGEGLGIIRENICYETGEPWLCPNIAKSLTFYSKGDEICGTMDSLTFNPQFTEKIDFEIFLDPVADYLFIRFDETNPVLIELFDLNGRKITQEIMESKSFQLDLTWLKSGMYVVRITSENKVVTKKIVKE